MHARDVRAYGDAAGSPTTTSHTGDSLLARGHDDLRGRTGHCARSKQRQQQEQRRAGHAANWPPVARRGVAILSAALLRRHCARAVVPSWMLLQMSVHNTKNQQE